MGQVDKAAGDGIRDVLINSVNMLVFCRSHLHLSKRLSYYYAVMKSY